MVHSKKVSGKKFDLTKNEIRYRLKNPERFDPDSFRRKKISKGVSLLIGCLEGKFKKGKCQAGTQRQAIRFDRSEFTPKQAAEWIDKNL